jgi:hypothetical protein
LLDRGEDGFDDDVRWGSDGIDDEICIAEQP